MLLVFSGSALLEDDKLFHLVRPADELDEVKSKRGSMKDKAPIKTITEIYLTRLLSMKVKTRQRSWVVKENECSADTLFKAT